MTAPLARRALAPLAGGSAALALSACVPRAATEQGDEVASLYNVFMIAAGVVFLVVVGLMAWSIVRYRGRPGRDVPPPPQVHGHIGLEVAWWAVPTALVAVLAVLTALVLSDVDAHQEQPAVTVGVEGFQWGWRFTYEDHDVVVTGTAADPPIIALPVGETIAFVVTSEDVVHSFAIPKFLIKRDAIPSRDSRFDVVIEHEGTYTGQCSEFCGLLHSYQVFAIEAVQPAEFEAWIAERRVGAP